MNAPKGFRIPKGMRYPKKPPHSGDKTGHKSGWREVWCRLCNAVTRVPVTGVKSVMCKKCGELYVRP